MFRYIGVYVLYLKKSISSPQFIGSVAHDRKNRPKIQRVAVSVPFPPWSRFRLRCAFVCDYRFIQVQSSEGILYHRHRTRRPTQHVGWIATAGKWQAPQNLSATVSGSVTFTFRFSLFLVGPLSPTRSQCDCGCVGDLADTAVCDCKWRAPHPVPLPSEQVAGKSHRCEVWWYMVKS